MIRFNCDKTTYKVVKKLKEALNQYLAYRAANPGYTDWSQNTREGTLLSAIVKLLTLEVKVISPVSAEPIESDQRKLHCQKKGTWVEKSGLMCENCIYSIYEPRNSFEKRLMPE